MVYFTMTFPNSELVSGKVTFRRDVADVGGGYNKTTGEFVCPVAGLYHFYFSFMQKSTTSVNCFIQRNGFRLTEATTWSDNIWSSASTSAYIQLTMGDIITVGDCDNWKYVGYNGNEGVFTGSLIHV